MKKLIFLIVIIGVLSLIITGCNNPTVPPVEQSDLSSLTKSSSIVWVDDDFTTLTPGWWTTHFNKIQDGINAVTVGGTVNVAAGTYHNDIHWLTKKITLVGGNADFDPEGRIDRSNETIVTRDDGNAFWIQPTAAETIINGIKFGSDTSESGRRIYINNAENVTIKYCIFYNTTGHGVAIGSDANGSEISYNTFSNTAWEAIANFGASDVALSNNTIKNIPTNYGIYLSTGSNTKVKDNIIFDTFHEAIRCDGTTVISGNTITDIDVNKGIFLGASSNAIVIDNVISNTYYEGIQAWAPVTITGNDISGCRHGIQIRNHATGTIIKWNNIHDNTFHGLEIPNYSGEPYVTGATITNNIFTNNGYTGVNVGGGTDGSGININYNGFEGNVYFGVESGEKAEGLYVDATRNWWGHASGPSGEYGRVNKQGKVIGKGDAVSNYVNWDPWLSQPTVPPTQILNKWDLEGTFEAHPGYNWGIPVTDPPEDTTWEYSIHIKEAMNGDFSVGSIYFSTGDIEVTGIVEQTKSDYDYWSESNLAAAGRAEYNGITYNFFFLFSERAIWFAISEEDLEPLWTLESVWPGSLRAYQLHSKVPDETFIMDPKNIH